MADLGQVTEEDGAVMIESVAADPVVDDSSKAVAKPISERSDSDLDSNAGNPQNPPSGVQRPWRYYTLGGQTAYTLDRSQWLFSTEIFEQSFGELLIYGGIHYGISDSWTLGFLFDSRSVTQVFESGGYSSSDYSNKYHESRYFDVESKHNIYNSGNLSAGIALRGRYSPKFSEKSEGGYGLYVDVPVSLELTPKFKLHISPRASYNKTIAGYQYSSTYSSSYSYAGNDYSYDYSSESSSRNSYQSIELQAPVTAEWRLGEYHGIMGMVGLGIGKMLVRSAYSYKYSGSDSSYSTDSNEVNTKNYDQFKIQAGLGYLFEFSKLTAQVGFTSAYRTRKLYNYNSNWGYSSYWSSWLYGENPSSAHFVPVESLVANIGIIL